MVLWNRILGICRCGRTSCIFRSVLSVCLRSWGKGILLRLFPAGWVYRNLCMWLRIKLFLLTLGSSLWRFT